MDLWLPLWVSGDASVFICLRGASRVSVHIDLFLTKRQAQDGQTDRQTDRNAARRIIHSVGGRAAQMGGLGWCVVTRMIID